MSSEREKVGKKHPGIDLVIGWDNTPRGTPLGYFSDLPTSETSAMAYDEEFFQEVSTSKDKRIRVISNSEWSDV